MRRSEEQGEREKECVEEKKKQSKEREERNAA
jgi:hypothetical protein